MAKTNKKTSKEEETELEQPKKPKKKKSNKKKVEKSTKKKILKEKEEVKEAKKLNNEMKTSLKQTKEIDYENMYPYCSYNPDNKSIILDLESLFGRDDISYVNTFPLTRRNYHSIAPLIVNDYNLILNAEECDDFIFYILNVQRHVVDIKEEYLELEKGFIVKNKKMTDFEKKAKMILDKDDKMFLINKVNEILDHDYLFNFIDKFVDEHYELELNSRIDVNEKNLEYAITDEINKTVLKTSIVARLLIPLVNEINIDDNNLYKLLMRVMIKFDKGKSSTKDKLYKFIELRVNRTRYSDSTIWDFLSNRAIDSSIYISELNRKIINEIIPKLEYNKSIVSYFDVIIRYKIRFLFTYNYNVNYKTIKTNDKELDDKEKLEIHLNRHDIWTLNMHKLSIKMLVDKFNIDEDEYDLELISKLKNSFTTKFLEMFYYSEEFDVTLAEPLERAKLIVHMREELLENGFEIIPDIILSEISISERRTTNRRKIDPDIVSSKEFKKFSKDYRDVEHLFIKNNHPLMQLSSIKNYNVYQPIDEESAYELEFNHKNLAMEILSLCYYYVHK